jgi:phosphohistidine phosphatase SixA
MEPTPAKRVATGRIRYYLLCRHGPYGNGDLLTQTRDGSKEYPTDAIALRLAETLADLSRGDPGRRIRLGAIVHAETKAAKLTAEHIADTLTPLADDDTKYTCAASPKLVEGTSGTDVKAVIDDLNARNGHQIGNAVLAVGHQPQLSWIADELLNASRRWPRRPPTPIDRAGMVCIEGPGRRRGRLCWAISYDDKAVAEEVREKIRRKMDTAKLLSGAVAFGLTATFGVLLDDSKLQNMATGRVWAVRAASLALLLAGLLYFATMYAYDSLLMPQRFWGEGRPPRSSRPARRRTWLVARPPSSAAWVLYQNMMRIWRNLFTTASVLVAFGISALGYAALQVDLLPALIYGVVLVTLTLAWIWWSRPLLGSED